MAAPVIDLEPARVRVLFRCGDPLAFRVLVLDDEGDLVDVSLWSFRGTVDTGRERLDFTLMPDEGGVTVWMSGDDTIRIPDGKPYPFDVSGMQAAAGEGVTLVGGDMQGSRRVSTPLRSDPDAVPAEGVPA